jgi:hypothetical protein
VDPSPLFVANAQPPHDLIRRARRRDPPAIFGALPPLGLRALNEITSPMVPTRTTRLTPARPTGLSSSCGSRRCCDLLPSRIGAAASHAVQDNGGLRATDTGIGGDRMGWPVSDMSEPCSRSAAIILSFNGKPSRELVEALVDRLITLLDAEDAVSYEMEPDADLEESDEGETETSSEWHLQDSVQRRRRGTVCNDVRPPSRLSRDMMNARQVQRPLPEHGNVGITADQGKMPNRNLLAAVTHSCELQEPRPRALMSES